MRVSIMPGVEGGLIFLIYVWIYVSTVQWTGSSSVSGRRGSWSWPTLTTGAPTTSTAWSTGGRAMRALFRSTACPPSAAGTGRSSAPTVLPTLSTLVQPQGSARSSDSRPTEEQLILQPDWPTLITIYCRYIYCGPAELLDPSFRTADEHTLL